MSLLHFGLAFKLNALDKLCSIGYNGACNIWKWCSNCQTPNRQDAVTPPTDAVTPKFSGNDAVTFISTQVHVTWITLTVPIQWQMVRLESLQPFRLESLQTFDGEVMCLITRWSFNCRCIHSVPEFSNYKQKNETKMNVLRPIRCLCDTHHDAGSTFC